MFHLTDNVSTVQCNVHPWLESKGYFFDLFNRIIINKIVMWPNVTFLKVQFLWYSCHIVLILLYQKFVEVIKKEKHFSIFPRFFKKWVFMISSFWDWFKHFVSGWWVYHFKYPLFKYIVMISKSWKHWLKYFLQF